MSDVKTVQALVPDTSSMAYSGRSVEYINGYEAGFEAAKDALIAQMQREAVQPAARDQLVRKSVRLVERLYNESPTASLSVEAGSWIQEATQLMLAAPHPEAQALDSQLQQPDGHSTRASGVCASTTRYAPWSAKTDAEMLHTLSVEFENSVSYCECGRSEPLRDFDCASMLRDYMAQRAVEAQPGAQQQDDHAGSPAPSARAIHYPECWDTAAYPTLESALAEVCATFRCTNEDTHPAPSAESSKAALSDEIRRLAQVAVDEASGMITADWQDAALKVCEAILARAGITPQAGKESGNG